jgi:hypothetical protein
MSTTSSLTKEYLRSSIPTTWTDKPSLDSLAQEFAHLAPVFVAQSDIGHHPLLAGPGQMSKEP